ncbi:MAG: beta-ketoacyl-ACP synthase II [Lentisphaeria bacterium]|nr:beta-ketoacyl-ACP synthase II [Lentisphaeria bacterium]
MSLQQKRVVITGLGAVSPVGNDVDSCWQNLLAGKSGIGPVTKFDATGYRCMIAGEVKGLDTEAIIGPKEAKRLDLFCHYAVVASDEALAQAGLTEAKGIDETRAGVIVSSGIGGLTTIEDQIRSLAEKGPRGVSAMSIPMMISNMASGYVAIRHHLKGPNFCIVTACASGLHSIGEAYWMIVRGDADVMVCGGTEAVVEPFSLAGFGSLKALSANNDDPEHASRPFDKDRDGFVPAEGAGVLVIESEEHAKKRGANILAEIVGYGLSADAFHITAPAENGEGSQRAIKMAFQHAGLPYDALDYVNAHGTSTRLNDTTETTSLKMVLGERAKQIPVSSTKSMTGHMLGAAGGFESVVCVKSIMHGIVPPTINYTTPDPDCDLDYVPNEAREVDVRLALNNNLGFGGHNASVLFAKYE